MQRRTTFLAAWSLVAVLTAGAAPRLAAQTGKVACESRGASREQCAIDRGVRVELTKHLSDTPCRENTNWGVGQGFIWVSGGCRAEFTVTKVAVPPPAQGPGNAMANPNQLRACRAEADRRLAAYSYDQIQVEPDARQGNIAYVRWRAGMEGGLCTVAANGRIIEFTMRGAGGGTGGAVGTTTRMTCESKSTGREECRIPQGAQIRLVRQISQNPCRLNDTYGTGAGYIWVAKGCRGEFDVTQPAAVPVPTPVPASGKTTTVVCQSVGNVQRACPIPAGATVRLAKQLSAVPCRLGQSYGVGKTFVWVNRGCAAEFEVTERGATGGASAETGVTTTRVVCESKGAERTQCQVAGATQVRLVKQYSTSPCTLNQTYGTGAGHLWVSQGCRGEFEVTIGAPASGAGAATGTGLPEQVTCESKGGERTECRIRTGGQVRLVRQLSSAACTTNSTWGTGSGVIWVTKGCRAEFEVR